MRLLRKLLRFFCKNVKVRGRHKLASVIGKVLAPSEIEIININGIRFPIDHSIEMYRYIYYGMYEDTFVDFLHRTVRPGDQIIEPGVNLGYITAILSGLVGKEGRIIGLEPSRICFDRISSYLKNSNIFLLNKALADRVGESTFIDKDMVITHGFSSLSQFTSFQQRDNEYLIETETVDDLMQRYQIPRVRLLKLDIEGAELLAVIGAEAALSEKKIDYLLIETTFVNGFEERNKEMFRRLQNNGYKPYLMAENSIKPVDLNEMVNTRTDIIWSHIHE